MSMPAIAAPAFSDPSFIAGRPEDVVLADAPINPNWIVSGHPVARAGLHSPAIDGNAETKVWECTTGSFWWTFHDEETVVILEGGVRVTSANGETRLLEPGSIAYFADGTKALWEIETYVKKIAFCRRPTDPVKRLRAMLGKMRRVAFREAMSVRVLGTIGIVLPL